jgi:predicted lipoprotein with Yx(FWY)xxD motif
MELVTRLRGSTGRCSGRTAVAVLAVAGLSASIVVGSAGAASNPRAKSVVVSTTKNAKLGTILVSGNTVYTLKASMTPCSKQCLKIWPEVLLPKGVKHAKPGAGVTAARLGITRRSGGALQVTYSGKALYRFSGDKTDGQVNGDLTDIWGTWSVVVLAAPLNISSPSASNAPVTPFTTPAPSTLPTPATAPPPPQPSSTTTPTTSPTTTTTAPGTGGVSF